MKKKSLKGSIVLVCLTGVYLYLQDKPTIQQKRNCPSEY